MDSQRVPYLYSVLQLVPRVERGESMNIGLIMFCRPQRFLKVASLIDEARIQAFARGVDCVAIKELVNNYANIAAADNSGGPVSSLDIGERFHWLTNISNTIVQPGPVHPGLTTDAQATFDRLFRELVEPMTSGS